MGKSTHFFGQPLYFQVIKLLDKSKVLNISRQNGGERYVKSFDGWTHLVVMLYAVIMRFDSLREITTSLQAEARKLGHLGISVMTSRSTLAHANKRRPESVFEAIYRDLYATHRHRLSSDSRSHKDPQWMKRLQIIDSTTITLFSNLLLMIMLTRRWSFSGLATMVRITQIYYIDFYSPFNHREKDWESLLAATSQTPPQPTLFG